ncbi:Hypothetical predicted protein, partial [Xyrichtys novacula]
MGALMRKQKKAFFVHQIGARRSSHRTPAEPGCGGRVWGSQADCTSGSEAGEEESYRVPFGRG